MSGSIHAVQTHLKKIAEMICASEKRDLMLACIEYKDHCDRQVVSYEDFTPSVSKLKTSIDQWRASGGGDKPEAIASGIHAATKLSWRSDATKMLVLCADAPPHGVGCPGDSYPNGSPLGLDPLQLTETLVKKEVIIYTVGVNNPDRYTVSFLCTLSKMSGGRYLPLADASSLPTILLGGAEEEIELKKFEKMMDEEEANVINEAMKKGEVLGEEEIVTRVTRNMAGRGRCNRLHVSGRGGGSNWRRQEEMLAAKPNLADYNVAQSRADYSDMPIHDHAAAPMPSGPPMNFRNSSCRGKPRGGSRGRGASMNRNCLNLEAEVIPLNNMMPMPELNATPVPCSASLNVQAVEQVSEDIQADQVRRHLNRKKH